MTVRKTRIIIILAMRKDVLSSSSRPAQGSFRDLEAQALYCPVCKVAVPVRKRLLLVLPEGDKYEYLCANCGECVGTKIAKESAPGMGYI